MERGTTLLATGPPIMAKVDHTRHKEGPTRGERSGVREGSLRVQRQHCLRFAELRLRRHD